MIRFLKTLSFFLFSLFTLKVGADLDRLSECTLENSMKSICVRIALKENSIDSVREWFQTLMDRREETLESLRNEGVIVESAFLDRQPDGDFLIYYMRTKNIEKAMAVFQNSNLAIDAYHKDCKRKYCGTSIRLEQLLDLSVEVFDGQLPSFNNTESSFVLSREQERILNLVYEEVEIAIQEGNPPFAAIITDPENNILAVAHNQANTKQLAIAHAEIEAIQLACKKLKKKKLDGCILYANAESCAMCSTAIIKSGISQVFYGAPHEKGSNPDVHLLEINKKATPQLNIQGGFMREKFIEQINRGRNQTQMLVGQKESGARQETTIKDFGDILLKESKIGQFDDRIGAFANRNFKKGEVVIKWDLKALSEDEYEKLPQYEKENFCHHRNGICWLYPYPERHVNRFSHPNVVLDFDKQANIALRDFIKGEELSIADNIIEDF
jgi:tRNA(adenine34) deaminase